MLNSPYYSYLKGSSSVRNSLLFFIRGPLHNFLNPSYIYVLSSSIKKQNINSISLSTSKESLLKHLETGIDWFLYNQMKQPDEGISSHIEFRFSRLLRADSFPEVTGYIATTLFNYHKISGNNKVYQSAIRACNWLLSLQNQQGAFPEGSVSSNKPSVFNTAQIVDGFITAYKSSQNTNYLKACENACDWMVANQDSDGAWRKNTYKNIARTYDTKVAESLLRVYKFIPKEEYLFSAKKQISFALSNQKDNGWFYNCDNSIERNNEPLTHLIGYTVHGLMESYFLLEDEKMKDRILDSSKLILDKMLHLSEVSRHVIRGRYNSSWKPTVDSACVTGVAQIAISWFLIYRITKDTRYLNIALKTNDFLKSIQFRHSNKNINGAIPQSYPFWGDYGPYKICSWGIKYFLDSLMLEYEYKK